MPSELSGGEKQRVAIARALVKNSQMILADEPTGNLVSETGKSIFGLLKQISQEKLVVVVTHDKNFAMQYGDRIIELKDGEIISDTEKHILQSDEQTLQSKEIDGKVHFPFGFVCRTGFRNLGKHKIRRSLRF